MKIYLICPNQDESFWGFEKAIAWQGFKVNFMPLGIITVAAVAEKMGHSVKVTDARFQKIEYETDADVIGISFYNVQKEDAFKIAMQFKEKGKYVVLGGAYPRSSPEECKIYSDSIICGEGEDSFRDFLNDFSAGKPKEIYYSHKADMAESPVPAYHLLDLGKYRFAGINYSRGCPFNCDFCDIKEDWFNGRKVRYKSVLQVIKELEELRRLGQKNIFFHDDNFVGMPAKTKDLLKEIVKWQKKNRYKFVFMAEASLNIAYDNELLDLFREANFSTLFIGIESNNIESLKATNKLQNAGGDILGNIIKIQRKGITLAAGMITGFDADKKEIFNDMFHFIQKSGIIVTSLGPLVVLPGTPLERKMKVEGRLLDNEAYHPAFIYKKHVEMSVNYEPKNMSQEELIKGTNWVIANIYSHKGFSERFWNYVNNLGKNYKNAKVHGAADVANVSLKKLMEYTNKIFLSSPKQFYYNTMLLLKIMLLRPGMTFSLLGNLAIHNHIYEYYKKVIGDPDKYGKYPFSRVNYQNNNGITAKSAKAEGSSIKKNLAELSLTKHST